MSIDVYEYYSRNNVSKEIAGFLQNRWAALESGDKKWIRWEKDKPLVVDSPSRVSELVKRYRWMGVRSFYGTLEVFKKLSEKADVMERYEENVQYADAYIDIDIIDEKLVEDKWKYAVEAARIIGEWVTSRYGDECIYYVWSGAGIHVRIPGKCLETSELAGLHPIDTAFIVIEYVLDRTQPLLLEVIKESGYAVKLENLTAPKRVFTAPLSLHRRLDRSAVAFTHKEIKDFTLEWSNPENPVYVEKPWNRAVAGKYEKLVLDAVKTMGKPPKRSLLGARATRIGVPAARIEAKPPTRETLGEAREPGRFPVMALLQAARYYLLTGDMDKAKSFGLNRAIFYAWAKYYGPAKRPVAKTTPRRIYGRTVSGPVKRVEVIGEKTQIGPSGYFVMGGIEQRPEDFDRYVARKFEEAGIKFEEAWKKALEYIQQFPKTVLKDPQEFYKQVYEPVRDRFIEKVLRRKHSRMPGLDRWLSQG